MMVRSYPLALASKPSLKIDQAEINPDYKIGQTCHFLCNGEH